MGVGLQVAQRKREPQQTPRRLDRAVRPIPDLPESIQMRAIPGLRPLIALRNILWAKVFAFPEPHAGVGQYAPNPKDDHQMNPTTTPIEFASASNALGPVASHAQWEAHAALLNDSGDADMLRNKTFAIVAPATARLMNKFTAAQLRAVEKYLQPDHSSGKDFYSDATAGEDLIHLVTDLGNELAGAKNIILALNKCDAWILGTILLWRAFDEEHIALNCFKSPVAAAKYWKDWGYNPEAENGNEESKLSPKASAIPLALSKTSIYEKDVRTSAISAASQALVAKQLGIKSKFGFALIAHETSNPLFERVVSSKFRFPKGSTFDLAGIAWAGAVGDVIATAESDDDYEAFADMGAGNSLYGEDLTHVEILDEEERADARDRAWTLLKKHWPKVEKLADEIIKNFKAGKPSCTYDGRKAIFS